MANWNRTPSVQIGQSFERLTVWAEAPHQKGRRMLVCLCVCGAFRITQENSLKMGHTRSCGCLNYEKLKQSVTKHGESTGERKTRLYKAWLAMKARTTKPSGDRYTRYGGRGIHMCDRWFASYTDFRDDLLQAIGPWPGKGYSVDRIDNNGHYEPGNVRWATGIEQANNTSKNRSFSYQGRTLTVAQWSREVGIHYLTLYNRLITDNWPIERALTAPVRIRVAQQ